MLSVAICTDSWSKRRAFWDRRILVRTPQAGEEAPQEGSEAMRKNKQLQNLVTGLAFVALWALCLTIVNQWSAAEDYACKQGWEECR